MAPSKRNKKSNTATVLTTVAEGAATANQAGAPANQAEVLAEKERQLNEAVEALAARERELLSAQEELAAARRRELAAGKRLTEEVEDRNIVVEEEGRDVTVEEAFAARNLALAARNHPRLRLEGGELGGPSERREAETERHGNRRAPATEGGADLAPRAVSTRSAMSAPVRARNAAGGGRRWVAEHHEGGMAGGSPWRRRERARSPGRRGAGRVRPGMEGGWQYERGGGEEYNHRSGDRRYRGRRAADRRRRYVEESDDGAPQSRSGKSGTLSDVWAHGNQAQFGGDEAHFGRQAQLNRNLANQDQFNYGRFKNPNSVLLGARENAEIRLERMTSTPFTHAIREQHPPAKFSAPSFELYDGKSDPIAHVASFSNKMALWVSYDAVMCKMFPASLGRVATKCFHSLGPDTIYGWNQLARIFVAHFIANSRDPVSIDALFDMKTRKGESLRQFSARFMETLSDMDNFCEETVISTFRLALSRDSRLRESLTLGVPPSLAHLQERIRQYVKLEDDVKTNRDRKSSSPPIGKDNGRSYRGGRDDRPDRGVIPATEYKAVHTVFRMPIYRMISKIKDRAFFHWPTKQHDNPKSGDPNKWCSYHREAGHLTVDCGVFRNVLEKWAAEGHLNEFISGKTEASGNDDRDKVNDEKDRQRKVIH